MTNSEKALEFLKLANRVSERLDECGVPLSLKDEAFQKLRAGGILCVDRTDEKTTRLSFVKAKGAA